MSVRMICLFGQTLIASVLLVSCQSVQKVTYFQNAGLNNQADVIISTDEKGAGILLPESHFKPKDILSISVVSSNQEATKVYNLLTPQVSDLSSSLNSQPTLQTYLVNNKGYINFPTIGKIKVAGMTSAELEFFLLGSIRPAFSEEEPVITVRINNFSVEVLGEVSKPGRYLVSNERVTLIDALAMAGDMTLYGRRDNITVLRENEEGVKQFLTVNLNDRSVVNSAAYYLEQNDVVYVEPNLVRKRAASIGSAETLSISAFSIVISMVSLLVNILK
jgi:polysaccharide biosynthesis/export protein